MPSQQGNIQGGKFADYLKKIVGCFPMIEPCAWKNRNEIARRQRRRVNSLPRKEPKSPHEGVFLLGPARDCAFAPALLELGQRRDWASASALAEPGQWLGLLRP